MNQDLMVASNRFCTQKSSLFNELNKGKLSHAIKLALYSKTSFEQKNVLLDQLNRFKFLC